MTNFIDYVPEKKQLHPFITFGDCKKGETAAKTGCTPASGGGGKKEGEAPASEETGEETEKPTKSTKGQPDKDSWDKPLTYIDKSGGKVTIPSKEKQVGKYLESMRDVDEGPGKKALIKSGVDAIISGWDQSWDAIESGKLKTEKSETVKQSKEETEGSPDTPDYHRIDPDVMGDVAWRHRNTLSDVAEAVERGDDFDMESIGNLIKDLQGLQDQAKGGFKKSSGDKK
ncbi:MAG: hypothetical protein CL793_07315 [Chloroflexi bacterium]|nr:hypothetical protein [Chloroflexota bacterium]|tara:strand:- start:70 stop:753 length:684 start_codon:yes stop_codon:yes gene_type:complete